MSGALNLMKQIKKLRVLDDSTQHCCIQTVTRDFISHEEIPRISCIFKLHKLLCNVQKNTSKYVTVQLCSTDIMFTYADYEYNLNK